MDVNAYEAALASLSPDAAWLFRAAAHVIGVGLQRGVGLGPGEVMMVGRARDVAGLLGREPVTTELAIAVGPVDSLAEALVAWGMRCDCGDRSTCMRLARAVHWSRSIRAAGWCAQVIMACGDATLEMVSLEPIAGGDA